VSVLAWGGLRIGEALALQRRDVDLDAGTITVARSLSEIDGVMHVTDTKTGRTRTVTLPATVTAELRTHLGGLPITPGAYLFPARNGEPRRYRNFLRDQWRPMLKRVNADRAKRDLPPLEVMPHDLRSSCASVLIDAGASPKDVQAHLGHADISTTLNLYARVRPGRAQDLASRMDQLIGTAAPDPTETATIRRLPGA
jgi:integrase